MLTSASTVRADVHVQSHVKRKGSGREEIENTGHAMYTQLTDMKMSYKALQLHAHVHVYVHVCP